MLNELETLGLIKFDAIAGFIALNIPDVGVITYTNGVIREIDHHEDNAIPIGNVMLTEAGKCLQKITQAEPLLGYEELEKEYMIQNGVKYKEETEYNITDNGDGRLLLKRVVLNTKGQPVVND